MAAIRAFVAVEVSDASRRELARLLNSFRASQADVKWVSPENVHLTLKFLGEVSPEALGRTVAALEEVARDTEPFSLRLGGVGAFPKNGPPRVIWVGVAQGTGQLAGLAARVDEVLAREGFPRESRTFSAHLTLGRVRSGAGRERLEAVMSRWAGFSSGPGFTVNRVVLFSSDLRPTGPVYTPIAALRFQVGGPIPEGG